MEKTVIKDKKITCPKCGSKECFEEPIKEDITSWLCMGCGFTSNSIYEIGSKTVEEIESTTTQLIKEVKFEDKKRNVFWYPSVIRTIRGMVYPEGTKKNWKWSMAPVIVIPEEERKNYPVEGKKNKYYETRLAVDKAEQYNKDNFKDAVDALGVILKLDSKK